MDVLLHTPTASALPELLRDKLKAGAHIPAGDELIGLVRNPTTEQLGTLQRLGEYCPYDQVFRFDTPETQAIYDSIAPQPSPWMFAVIPGGHPSTNVPAIIEQKLNAVDEAAGEARHRHCSCGWGIEEEYRLTEREAREFAAAGYPAGAVPPCVQAEADTSSSTPQQAAENIIIKADALNGALATIRALRLTGKRAVEACTVADLANPTGAEMRALLAAGETELQQLQAMAAAVVGS